ncbi:hypothetical protein C2E23DRAFT_716869 [Lenzites betulinus]|nr:hypothetical protein C2E23DRAFT_716869 [Lenzites betulinus]
MEETNVRSPFDDADADIIIRSADRVDFRLYKLILKKASDVFRDMFTLPDAADEGQPQVVELTEDADTLERLFRLCYPAEFPVFKTCDEIFPVLDAAQKYAISSVVAFARRALRDRAEKESPLRTYAIAWRYEFPALARKAARLLVKEPDHMALHSLPPEIAALPYASLSLARYRSACRQAVVDELARTPKWLYEGDHAHRGYLLQEGSKLTFFGLAGYKTWVWYRCTTCPRHLGHHRVPVCAWWVRYDTAATVALLKGGLDGDVMVHDNILADALGLIPQCDTCTFKTACEQLMDYASALKTRIEKAIDEVSGGSILS